MKLKLISIFAASIVTISPAAANELPTAEKICNLLNATMILTLPCKVDDKNQSISFVHNINARTGLMMCQSVQRIAQSNGWRMPAGWKIKVGSKEQDGKIVATCTYEKDKYYYS